MQQCEEAAEAFNFQAAEAISNAELANTDLAEAHNSAEKAIAIAVATANTVFASPQPKTNSSPKPRLPESPIAKRTKFASQHPNLTILGDSMARHWDKAVVAYKAAFPPAKTINQAKSGKKASHLLDELRTSIKTIIPNRKTEVVIINVGTNDLDNGVDAKDVLGAISLAAEEVKLHCKNARVMVMAIPPQRDGPELKQKVSRKQHEPKRLALNTMLMQASKRASSKIDELVTLPLCIEMAEISNYLRREDNIHLNNEANSLIIDIVSKRIKLINA